MFKSCVGLPEGTTPEYEKCDNILELDGKDEIFNQLIIEICPSLYSGTLLFFVENHQLR